MDHLELCMYVSASDETALHLSKPSYIYRDAFTYEIIIIRFVYPSFVSAADGVRWKELRVLSGSPVCGCVVGSK